MITFNEKRRLMGLLPEFYMYTGFENAGQIKEIGVIEAKNVEEVLDASEMGLGRREIFFNPHTAADTTAVLGKCRVVAESWEDLVAINEGAAPATAEGRLLMVGLRIAADGFKCSKTAITTQHLRELVYPIKQLKNISVCGCIVTADIDGLHGKDLGKYVRSSYQTAKEMTYILPCTMPYICVDGCLEAAAWNEAEHPEDFEDFLTAANIVGMQNVTAFYADYYLQ